LLADVQQLLGAEYAEGATPDASLKAVIAPHAGLRYSGGVAAGVYARFDVHHVQRIFMLGPSHHAYIEGCGLPREDVVAYQTPMGNLPLDLPVLAQLRKSGCFSALPMSIDEAEHSLELQLPFLATLLLGGRCHPQKPAVTLIPILVGQVSPKDEATYGQLLAPYLEAEGSIFVVSSDFCHWGAQFGYMTLGDPKLAKTYVNGPYPENAAIEGLDREGMNLIAAQNGKGFRDYLAREGNTICGRHPILVFLEILQRTSSKMGVDFVKYAQSSAMPGAGPPTKSSVSYACARCLPVKGKPLTGVEDVFMQAR